MAKTKKAAAKPAKKKTAAKKYNYFIGEIDITTCEATVAAATEAEYIEATKTPLADDRFAIAAEDNGILLVLPISIVTDPDDAKELAEAIAEEIEDIIDDLTEVKTDKAIAREIYKDNDDNVAGHVLISNNGEDNSATIIETIENFIGFVPKKAEPKAKPAKKAKQADPDEPKAKPAKKAKQADPDEPKKAMTTAEKWAALEAANANGELGAIGNKIIGNSLYRRAAENGRFPIRTMAEMIDRAYEELSE